MCLKYSINTWPSHLIFGNEHFLNAVAYIPTVLSFQPTYRVHVSCSF